MSTPKPIKIDADYLLETLETLLKIPSPSGRTDDVMHEIGRRFDALGVETELTRRGALVATIPGEGKAPCRAYTVHADTIGAMVRSITDNGRLKLAMVGTHPARSAEGATVKIFTDSVGVSYTGTILPLKASGHAFGDEVDKQGWTWEDIEVRIDAPTSSAEDTRELGIQIGDFVALISFPRIDEHGFVNARHLDGKAGVASALAAVEALVREKVRPPVDTHVLVTIAEEVGQGASSGLHEDVAEMIAIDNAVVAPGQASREDAVSVCMLDSSGPTDYHLSRKLLMLAAEHDIDVVRDVYRYYRADIAAAIEAGAEMRVALLGFGVDGSHGHERTHRDSLVGLAELVTIHAQTPLTFSWDESPRGPLAEFPEQTDEPEKP
ncbi:MAG: osmoprotectant NAGGN system M42 family peptidase [Actinomycetota bacterium]